MAQERGSGEDETALLRTIQLYSILLLAVMVAASWYLYSRPLAISIFLGGLLANGSFILLRRDITRFMDDFVRAGENAKGVKRIVKVRLFFNFYTRLAVIGVILYLLSGRLDINMVGLAIGLSTIMISVFTVVLGKRSMLFSLQRYKGA